MDSLGNNSLFINLIDIFCIYGFGVVCSIQTDPLPLV